MRLLSYGDRALLAELDPATVLPALAALRGLPGVEELVPGARTLLIRLDPARFDRTLATGLLSELVPAPAGSGTGEPISIPVRYDGPDLELVADAAGCSVTAVVQRHTERVYSVAFCGFAPGFAYLTGLDETLWQPRLAEPRFAVPAGSVGIAGEFTGVYPRSSPGGWRLLGRTDAQLWDLGRTPPALLTPGARVRFVP
jgi:KipI family sensor histidine kinase inhibitor